MRVDTDTTPRPDFFLFGDTGKVEVDELGEHEDDVETVVSFLLEGVAMEGEGSQVREFGEFINFR